MMKHRVGGAAKVEASPAPQTLERLFNPLVEGKSRELRNGRAKNGLTIVQYCKRKESR